MLAVIMVCTMAWFWVKLMKTWLTCNQRILMERMRKTADHS